MKIKRSLIGMCLVGVTFISAVPSYAAISDTVKSPRVPEKAMYTGVMSQYSQECIDAGFYCHDFNCPRTFVEAPDYGVFPGNVILGDKPSYEKNSSEMEVKFFLQNQMPFTLPIGKITLNEIVGKNVFPEIELDIKQGVNTYEIKVGDEVVKTAPIKGVSINNTMGSYSDLSSKHWAYQNIKKAVENGWVTPESSTTFGVAKYANVTSPVTGQVFKERVDGITLQELFTGINRVLMSNGIYLGDNLSRTDLNKYLGIAETFASKEQLASLFNLEGINSNYADWLNVAMSAAVVREEITALDYYETIEGLKIAEGDIVDRYVVSMIMHNIVYDMNLPVVNKMEGPEYSYYDDTYVRNNYIVGAAGYRSGSSHYVISRGLISPEKVNGKFSDFSGEAVGKPELATILCNLDRAIKASKTVK